MDHIYGRIIRSHHPAEAKRGGMDNIRYPFNNEFRYTARFIVKGSFEMSISHLFVFFVVVYLDIIYAHP